MPEKVETLVKGSPTVSRVLKGELCTGCGLCATVAGAAIEMRDVGGYARPVQLGLVGRDAEAVIADACPGSKVEPWADGPKRDPYWGPHRQVLTAYATDERVRFEGSSGGGISALLIHALESGQIDSVLQVAADPERPTRNMMVRSRTREEIVACAGSRYTASSPLAQLEEALAQGGRMAFVGKPCDASALRRLTRHDPRVDQHIAFVVAFFCAGLPNHAGVERILRKLEVELDDVASFRYRGQGWPGYAVAVTKSGREARMTYADSWGGHLSSQVQFRCKICPDAVGGVADFVCADAWYGDEAGYPLFEEQDGRSLLMTRTETGDRLLASTQAAGAIVVEPLDIGEIEKMQPGQARRKRLVVPRSAAALVMLQPLPDMRGLRIFDAARIGRLGDALHNFLGTLRRILIGRR